MMSANYPFLMFLSLALALTFVHALAILLPSLRGRESQHSLLELNVQVFPRASGRAGGRTRPRGRVDEPTFLALKTELERQLLSLQPEANECGVRGPAWAARALWGLMVLLPVLAVAGYLALAWQPAVGTWWQVQLKTGPLVDKLFAGENPSQEEAAFPEPAGHGAGDAGPSAEASRGYRRLVHAGHELSAGPDWPIRRWKPLIMPGSLSPERDDISLAYAQTLLFTRQGRLDDQSRMLLGGRAGAASATRRRVAADGHGGLPRRRHGDRAAIPAGTEAGAYRPHRRKGLRRHWPKWIKVIALAKTGGEKAAVSGGIQVTVKHRRRPARQGCRQGATLVCICPGAERPAHAAGRGAPAGRAISRWKPC
jgi:cytochrome c-type biogenesis protein CcmI